MRGVCTFSQLGRYGRFANGMYQIAGTIGIARRNNMDFAFPEWKNYNHQDQFGSTEDIDVQKYFENRLPLYDGPQLPGRGVPWGYQDVISDRSTDLQGHFQSVKYFEHCLDEVKWYFRMKDEPPLNDYVAIHCRLGDYGNQPSPQHPDGNPHHPRMEMSYYEPAMSEFPGRKFLVFSDDIPACKAMFGDTVSYSEGNDYLGDFRLMKRCHSFIIGNSSYSAMAAVLGDAPDKKIVAPHPWFGGPYLESLDAKDIYSEDWIVIDYQKQERIAA